MKKILLILICLSILIIPVSAQEVDMIKYAEDLIQNATTQQEFDVANELYKMVTNPRIILSNKGVNPNGKYNYGKSKYEITGYDDTGGVIWERIN